MNTEASSADLTPAQLPAADVALTIAPPVPAPVLQL